MTEKDRNEGKHRTIDLPEGEVWHPADEEVVGLLDADGGSDFAPRVREHLTRCPRCFAIHAEAARTRLEWKWGGKPSVAPPEWVAAARAMARPSLFRAMSRPRPASAARRTPRRVRWPVAAAATLIAVLAPLGWLLGPGSDRWMEPVRSGVAQASRRGMVLSADVAPEGVAMRGGTDGPMDRALDRLAAEYERHAGAEEQGFWLAAALLASGQPDITRILDECRARHPQSARIANLEAVALYRAGRVEEADRVLSGILAHSPDDAVALFNRHLLLDAEGRGRERDSLAPAFSRAAERFPALAARFRRESAGR